MEESIVKYILYYFFLLYIYFNQIVRSNRPYNALCCDKFSDQFLFHLSLFIDSAFLPGEMCHCFKNRNCYLFGAWNKSR